MLVKFDSAMFIYLYFNVNSLSCPVLLYVHRLGNNVL